MKSKIFSINGRDISSEKNPYIIAELSANHNGSIERAKKTILAAANSGVDAVKIQSYTPDTMTIDSDNDDFRITQGLWKGRTLYDLYGEAYTPFDWHKELFEFARRNGVQIFSSPFDESAVDLLESLNAPAYKIASFELVDIPLIKYVASTQKPILLSTGMASMSEIGEAIETVAATGNNQILLFHCISSYPTPLAESNLSAIQKLKDTFDVQVGLSDHTIGNTASIIATTLGAAAIEKHFTLQRSDGGVDSSFSIEPAEMSLLIKETKETFQAIRMRDQIRSDVEIDNLIFRRSLYFVKNIRKGEVITNNHVRRIRPGYGLSPKYYGQVIGSQCQIDAQVGDRVTMDHWTNLTKSG